MGRLTLALLVCCLVAECVPSPGLGLIRPGLNEIELSVQQKLNKYFPDAEAKNRIAKQTPREKRSTDDVIGQVPQDVADETSMDRAKRTLELDPALFAKSQGPDEIIDPFDLERYLEAQPELHKVFSPSNPSTITVTDKAAPPCGAEHEPKVKQPILVIPRPVIVEHYEQPILLVHRTLPVVNDIYDEPTLVEKEIQQIVVEQVPAAEAHHVAKRSALHPAAKGCGCSNCRSTSEPAFYSFADTPAPCDCGCPNCGAHNAAAYSPYDTPAPCDCGCPNCGANSAAAYSPYNTPAPCDCGCPNCGSNSAAAYSPYATPAPCDCGCPNCGANSATAYSPYDTPAPCDCGCPNCAGSNVGLCSPYDAPMDCGCGCPNCRGAPALNPVFSYEYCPEEYRTLLWKRDISDEPEFLTVDPADPDELPFQGEVPNPPMGLNDEMDIFHSPRDGSPHAGDNAILGDLHDYAHIYPQLMTAVFPTSTPTFQYYETGQTLSSFGVPAPSGQPSWSSNQRKSPSQYPSSWPASPYFTSQSSTAGPVASKLPAAKFRKETSQSKTKGEEKPLVEGEPCLPLEEPLLEDLRDYATDGSEIDAEPEKRAPRFKEKTQIAPIESADEMVPETSVVESEDSSVSDSTEEESVPEMIPHFDNTVPTSIPPAPRSPSSIPILPQTSFFTPSYPGYYPSMDYSIREPAKRTKIMFQPYAQRITHPPVYYGENPWTQTRMPQAVQSNLRQPAVYHAEPEDEAVSNELPVDSAELRKDLVTFEAAKASLLKDIVEEVLKESPAESSVMPDNESATQVPEVPTEEEPTEQVSGTNRKLRSKEGKGVLAKTELDGARDKRTERKEADFLENEIFDSDSTVELRQKRQSRPTRRVHKRQSKVSKI